MASGSAVAVTYVEELAACFVPCEPCGGYGKLEVGTGERGRILRKSRCTETTVVALIGMFDGIEATVGIHYPNAVGVTSVDLSTMRRRRDKGSRRRNQDVLDPLAQRKP